MLSMLRPGCASLLPQAGTILCLMSPCYNVLTCSSQAQVPTSVSAVALASLSLRFSQRSASSSTKLAAEVGT